MKPRIGITPTSRIDDYVESIRRAGGEPLVLSNDDDPAAVLDKVDGLLLTGGLDVDPALYGQAAHPTTATAPERDTFEIPLSREAVKRDVPLFAICRGVQVLNVAEGGTLVQDIPSAVTTDLNHSVDVPKDHLAHGVKVTPGTRLAAALEAGSRTPPLKTPGMKTRAPKTRPAEDPAVETCAVNSRHHQAVDTVAPSFVVSAVSPDGVVEAIERPGATFCVGVQWHPENFWRTGEFGALFENFVEAAASRARR
jgi:putative glutamine amidotransferase